jgi:uncharacterized protein YdhG (YjbR/CyaY superfamily)
MPTFTLNGNLVRFAAFKKYIGFYPVSTGIEKFLKRFISLCGGKRLGAVSAGKTDPL